MEVVSAEIYQYLQRLKADRQEIPVKSYKKGEVISRYDEAYCIGYILSGEVRMVTTSPYGKRILVDELSKDEFCGHMSRSRGQNFKCDIIAGTDCIIMELHDKVFNLLLKDYGFAVYFYTKTTNRIYYMYKMMLMTYLFELDEIVAYSILRHRREDCFVCKSMYHLCDDLHISRRGFYNSINKLIKEGILEKSCDKYLIKDVEGLKAYAQNVSDFFEVDNEDNCDAI